MDTKYATKPILKMASMNEIKSKMASIDNKDKRGNEMKQNEEDNNTGEILSWSGASHTRVKLSTRKHSPARMNELDQQQEDKQAAANDALDNMPSNLYSSRLVLHDAADELLCARCGQWSFTSAALAKHHQTVHSTTDQKCEQNQPFCHHKTFGSVHRKTEEPLSKKVNKKTHKTVSETANASSKEIADNPVDVEKYYVLSNSNVHLKEIAWSHLDGREPNACNKSGKDNISGKDDICNLCSYRCSKTYNLKCHIRTHTGEKPFTCNLCPFKCVQRGNLTRHIRTHTDNKAYACNLCPYKCAVSSNLKRHMRSHTGEKPYACDLCAYTSSYHGDLNKHMKTHQPKKTQWRS